MLFVLAFLNLVMIIVKEWSFLEIGENLAVVVKKAAFKTTVNMDMAEIDRRGRPSLVHLVNTSSESAKALASQTISSLVDVTVTLLIGITIALMYCWQITLVALLLIPLTVAAGMPQNKFLTTLSKASDKLQKNTHKMVLWSILNNKTVASLNLQKRYISAYDAKQDAAIKITQRSSVFSVLTMAVSQCLIAFVICLIHYIAALIAKNFDVRFDNIFIAIYAVMFSGVQAGTNIEFISGIFTGFLRTAQYFGIVEENYKKLEHGHARRKSNPYFQLQEELDVQNEEPALDRALSNAGCVEFKNIYFRYPSRKEYLFEGLSFSAKPGERVAIVGQSGTGKTAVADLLFSIYAPNKARASSAKSALSPTARSRNVLASPSSPRNPPCSTARSATTSSTTSTALSRRSRKPPDFWMLSTSSRTATSGSRPSLKRDGSSDTRIATGTGWPGRRGVYQQGGQKQRIGIARALVRKPTVLVMDEDTSTLDKETEEKVLKNIEGLRCSQIIIAHRMWTIRSCDRILVIKNGRLAEMGTFEELMELKDEFSKLVAGKEELGNASL